MDFLLINKPEGWTSFDAVAYIRKNIKQGLNNPELNPELQGMLKQVEHDTTKKIKVGHAGTLDPFATGLLIIGVGREATKKLDEFKKLPKTYIATIKLGEVSDTYDKTGTISLFPRGSKRELPELSAPTPPTPSLAEGEDSRLTQLSLEKINQVLNSFTGKQLQIPPMFSAKKINGQRLYKLARQGIEIERQPNEIEIYSIKLLDFTWPILKIEVQCSAGTYIRTLAHDIGAKLGTGAYCQELVRTQIGDYSLTNAINLKT